MMKKWLGLVIGVAGAVGIFLYFKGKNDEETEAKQTSDRVAALVASEELILELTKELKGITKDLKNLKAPADVPESLAECVALWVEDADYFDSVSLKIVRGEFESDSLDHYVADLAFHAVVRTTGGQWKEWNGGYKAHWRKKGETYRMSDWKGDGDVSPRKVEKKFFTDRMAEALPDPRTRQRVLQSEHRRALSYHYSTNKKMAPSHDFEPISMSFKPAVSVVDVDKDGWDDIYIMVRLGRNLFLHNQGDGTFVEKAADWKLGAPGNSTCGIFADFDNDGDSDLVLGRSIERMLYLENTGFTFRVIEQKRTDLPYLATSLAAADYDGDGLLDLYVTTYRRGDLTGTVPGFAGEEGTGWCEKYLPADEAALFRRKYKQSRGESHGGYLNQAGPPNWLLRNTGNGQFERVHAKAPISSWKNSLQATWGDFDEDGDPDLAVANDWAIDHLFRNDGEKGFVDIAEQIGLDWMGFGMGVCWGDYNGDGADDLFITNMFSKAGQRVLSGFSKIDPKFLQSASGNFLYCQKDGRFQQVAGYGESMMPVAKSGWSWGGQFLDIDNDRDLDIHALSGYFTAPRSFESDIDL